MQEKWCLRSLNRSAERPWSVLRHLRIGQSLSQGELAELTGMSATEISRMENGKRGIALAKVLKLAVYFGINCDMLLENDFETLYSGEGSPACSSMDTVGGSAIAGVKFWRLKRRVTRKSLAKQVGIAEV